MGTISYIVTGGLVLIILCLVFQNGRMWNVLPEVMADAWHFSKRISVLSFAFTTMFVAWYLWNGEVEYPTLKNIYIVFMLMSVAGWIYFMFLEMRSISWETLLRESLCVTTWHDQSANLTPEEMDKVLSFLMANDGFLRKLMEVPDAERKEFIRNCSISFQGRAERPYRRKN